MTFEPSRRICLLLAAAVAAVGPAVVGAQDIEMLGRHYGTPLPDGYRRLSPDARPKFEFARGWRRNSVARDRTLFDGPLARVLGPPSDAVTGNFEIPVLLALYSNSGTGPPFERTEIQEAYFGSGPGTISHFYREVSGERVSLLGNVREWTRLARSDSVYTLGISGVSYTPTNPHPPRGGGGPGNMVIDLVNLQAGVDWGRYDNDGPDGDPNSGDDDGYVDVLAVIQPTVGAECRGGDYTMWSHRWSLTAAVGTPFETAWPSRNPDIEFVRIDDYTIQPSISCSGSGIAEIGTFTHELGHAFGLPDLYDTDGGHSGAGSWDLMSSGSWGCGNVTPETPCHLGAWSKAALGWVDVVTVAPGTDLGTVTLPPVATSDTVFRVNAQDGSGEYFLIENRQRIGYDLQLPEEGLLIWQIDQGVVDATWPSNRVNAGQHMGVWLRQADGQAQLGAGRGRGDSGDPFPGKTANSAFHSVSEPSTRSYAGGLSGLTMVDIAPVGDDMSFRLSTRFTNLTVRTEGAPAGEALLLVNGQEVDSIQLLASAPFVTHDVESAAGLALGPGERRPFVEWSDDPEALRQRAVVTPMDDIEYVARFEGTEFELAMTLSGGVGGVEPTTFASDPFAPDFWFPAGAAVTLTAEPRIGFTFQGWTGVLAGQGNPASFTMDGPLVAGADFDLVYAVPDVSVELPAATNLDVQLEVEQGTAPAQWRVLEGQLPLGVALSTSGRIVGASLDVGRFDVTVEAIDALGLPASGALSLLMVAPEIPIEELASLFLLSGASLDAAEVSFLAYQGNQNPGYDLGDFRAWVLSDATLPLTADLGPRVHRETIVISAPRPELDR